MAQMEKNAINADTGPVHETVGVETGTNEDALDMARLGRKQEFKRNFNFTSILGVTCVAMATWEAMITASNFSLINGGLAGTVWVYPGVLLCFSAVVASLADIASMSPTTAGQYAWVSEFAPSKYQKVLSYTVGWLSVVGWQSGIAVTAYTTGCLILEMAALNHQSYAPALWQQTLMTIAVVCFAFLCNTLGARYLPLLEQVILAFHVLGFFAMLIPLWVVAPKAPASEVFGSFSNFGGWSSTGAACVIGMLSAAGSLGGPDSAAHLAEEVQDASLTVPRVMMTTVFFNGILGFVMTITYCFCITDIETMIIGSTSVFPFLDVYREALSSRTGATALAAILVITQLGIPVPVNAAIFSLTLPTVLALINLGSTTAFNSIVGLLSGSGAVSYFISIGCVLVRRLRDQPLPAGRWSLGKFAIPINIFALCFLLLMTTISFFPLFAQVTVTTMNWSIVMFGGVTILAVLYYFLHGRKVYTGPVVHIRRN
ncbi:putative amino-acid permease PB24D3.02c [Pseudocercospora fuligena]|uniref:Putative amino-acid permease PB24D3.02c n=1 Tax=Pseudocercospora fuligena TaxID=685502 RepID=A0A8H6RUZ4_9PEZI|nr:putative amino-acid permease PB24D3.02c [Pseudocercospora fuligena]